jgi:hypothetical protein
MHTGGGGCVLRVLLISVVFCGALGALELADEANNFRVEVPDSLPKVRHDPARFPDTLYMFAEPERGGVLLQLMLLPEELKQVNPVPSAAAVEIAVLWKGLTLARRHRYFAAGAQGQAVEIAADVPVVKRGIRISITGPARRETELVGIFAFVLEHFEARSNWALQPSGASRTGPPPAPDSTGSDANEQPESSSNAMAGIAATIALVLGFFGGWWLRGLGARPVPPSTEVLPKLEPPGSKPLPPKPVVVVAKTPEPIPKKKPDETDPGVVALKCRVCGAEVRVGRKVCLNCGSEIF